jgi:hypothetical protein
MTMVVDGRRSDGRSGVARLAVETRTYDPDRVAVNNLASADTPKARARAEAFLDNWESYAFDVYRRHGLPTFLKCWRPGPGEPWRRMEERSAGQQRPGERFADAYAIGAEVAPRDSEVGFATGILRRVVDARRRLQAADSATAWLAFVDAAVLSQTLAAHRSPLGPPDRLGPGATPQAPETPRGGAERVAKTRRNTEERVRAWVDEDARLGRDLSLRSRARLIARRVRGSPFEASENTIRRALAKAARQRPGSANRSAVAGESLR